MPAKSQELMDHSMLQVAVTVQEQWWTLLQTTNQKITSPLQQEQASRAHPYMTSQIGEEEIQTWHSKIVPSSSWRYAQTPLHPVMKATDNCGTVIAGELRRISTPIRWEQHTETASTKRNHSTSLLWRSQMAVWSGKKRSSMFVTNEQWYLCKHVSHALETSNLFITLFNQVRYTDRLN